MPAIYRKLKEPASTKSAISYGPHLVHKRFAMLTPELSYFETIDVTIFFFIKFTSTLELVFNTIKTLFLPLSNNNTFSIYLNVN